MPKNHAYARIGSLYVERAKNGNLYLKGDVTIETADGVVIDVPLFIFRDEHHTGPAQKWKVFTVSDLIAAEADTDAPEPF